MVRHRVVRNRVVRHRVVGCTSERKLKASSALKTSSVKRVQYRISPDAFSIDATTLCPSGEG